MLRDRGLPVIDADQLAREVVAPGSEGLRDIVREFGEEVLDASGALDRKLVASKVFGNESARRTLNSITHPRVGALARDRTQALEGRGEPLACYEVPLLVEGGLVDALRPVVVVDVPPAVQLARTMTRDGCTEDEARARIAAQLPLEKKVEIADYVVVNTGDLEETRRQADATLDQICRSLEIDPARYPR